MGRVKNRFELLIFETAEEHLKKKAKVKAEAKRIADENRKVTENSFRCEGCEKIKTFLRWVNNNEIYCCYKCFIENLGCEADVMVPMRNITRMQEYMSEDIWNELWEEENGLAK